MLRPCLTIGIVLAVSVGCDDSLTAPVVPSEPVSTLHADVLASMSALLDDPFVHDVIVQVDRTHSDRTVQHTMQEVMDRVAAGEPQAILRALSEAHRAVQQSNDDETVVHRVALGLTFDAVKTVLDSAMKAEVAIGDASPLDVRGGHDD